MPQYQVTVETYSATTRIYYVDAVDALQAEKLVREGGLNPPVEIRERENVEYLTRQRTRDEINY